MGIQDSISLDHLTTIDASVLQTIAIAGQMRCRYISIIPAMPILPELGVPDIVRDFRLHQKIRRACEDHGVRIHALEGFLFTPDITLEALKPLFEMAAAVGAHSGVAIILDPNRPRVCDNFAKACEWAPRYGMSLNIEFTTATHAVSLSDTLDLIKEAGAPDSARIVVDILHLMRSGAPVDTLATIDPARIGAAQICDGFMNATEQHYRERELIRERLEPGQGDFPLAQFVRHLSPNTVIGVEVPMETRRLAGESTLARAQRAIEATRRLIRQIQ
jgi:sugar phosphate isomerase/epimerase